MDKPENSSEQLSRRERQVMDILLASGEATAAEVREKMPDSPSYSAVRAVLRVLEEKALIFHKHDGPRYVYRLTVPKQQAKKTMLKRVLDTFFEGSREQLVAALLETDESKVSSKELKKLARLIQKARDEGR